MAKSKRVLFTFDPNSYHSLRELTDRRRFGSMAETVRESVQTANALQAQAEQGFTEVIVRNPHTNEERVVVIATVPPSRLRNETPY